MIDAAIKTRSLTKHYGGRAVVKGLDWDLPVGSACALLGHNGAGKSTTLRLLMAFTPPSAGQATILGEDPWAMSPATRARIGYVSEDPLLPPWMKVGDLIAFHASFYRRWNRALERELLELFELPGEAVISTLSKGQNRRLMLVLALAQDADLLILDEPAAGLDVASRRQLLGLLGSFLSEEGKTLLISSHIVTDVERIVSQVAIMVAGRLVEFADLDELHENVKGLRMPLGTYDGGADGWRAGEVLAEETAGPTKILTVRRFDRVADLARRDEVEVIDMPLEDVFLAISGARQVAVS